MARDALGVYRTLLRTHGPQGWWPARTRFEVVVGAMLMAQTSWTRVEEALGNLRRAGWLDPGRIAAAPLPRLAALVRPAGLYRSKPRRLRALCRAIVAAGGLDALLRGPTADVRARLLALEGVGPETADSILLYAADRPVFVVDAYTRRIAERLGFFRGLDDAGIQGWFESRLPRDARLFNEYHALLVTHGKALCRPRPRCGECPLRRACDRGRQVYPRPAASRRG